MPIRFWKSVVLAMACCLWVTNCWAAGGEAELAFQKGQRLVADGNLRAAVQALATAVKLERDNQQYLQQYLVTRQAVTLQSMVDSEEDPQRWEKAALALSSFYTSQGLHARALPVDEAMFQRLKSADSAVQLAETLLSLGQSARAAEVLAGLGPQRATTASQALLCVSLARQGRHDEAKRLAAALPSASNDDPGTLFLTARAQAVLDRPTEALATLVLCFEAVPPSRLDPLKSHTKLCKDFAALADEPAFARALATQSKVPESKCSGGSSCSSCPMRGSCAHDQAK